MIRRFNEKEEEIMFSLWTIKKGFIQDIIDEMDEPKPHYNTTSSIVRKLELEGYISHDVLGRSHKYFPISSKKEYRSSLFDHLYKHYFKCSKRKFVSYTMDKLEISKSEMKRLL